MAEKQSVEQVGVNVLYMMSWAMDRFLLDIELRLKTKKILFRREKKAQFNKLMDAIRRAYRASEELRADIEVSASPSDYKDLDIWADETNEMCRLILLYADKCGKHPDDSNQVFKLLRSFEGEGIITEDVLKRFYLKK